MAMGAGWDAADARLDRRRFLSGSALAVATFGLGGCGGDSSGMSAHGSPVAVVTATTGTNPVPASTAPRFLLWGDSRTEGIGGTRPDIFPNFVAQQLTAYAVINEGLAGQTAAEVIARQGGAPTQVTLAGNAIPASGPVSVTSLSVNIFDYGAAWTDVSTMPVTLAGVAGTLSTSGGAISFTRTSAGAQVAVAPGTPFLTAVGEASRGAYSFFCVGRNGLETQDPAAIVNLTLAGVNYLTTPRRYMVAGVMPDLSATVGSSARPLFDRLNAMLRQAHGAAYLDLVTPPSDAEMAAIGYAPTSADRTDIAAGVFPRGMFSDNIHLLGNGQRVWANRVVARVNG